MAMHLDMACRICRSSNSIYHKHSHVDEETGWRTHIYLCKPCYRQRWRDHTKLEEPPKTSQEWNARNREYVEGLLHTVEAAENKMYSFGR